MRSMYEPVHGSAPDIAGKGIANPIATILSFSMALKYSLNLDKEALDIEKAVQKVLDDGLRTKDIFSKGNKEVSTNDVDSVEVGQSFNCSIFEVGEKVIVQGISKGKGFAGTVKRYNFKGGPKTHGQSDRHRAPGSIGAGSSPGRVWKGTKMSGHMGDVKVSQKGLKIIKVDSEKNTIEVRGSVPGANSKTVIVIKENYAS